MILLYIAAIAAIAIDVSLLQFQPTASWIGWIMGHRDCSEELDDGSFYQGGCNRDGQWHGLSVYGDVNDGNLYVGQFKEGEMHGIGSFFRKDGYGYQGEFKVGKQNGHGIAIFPSGRVYIGTWKDGEPVYEEGLEE